MGFSPAIIEGLKLSLSDDNGHAVIRSTRPARALAAEYSFGVEEEYFLADAKTLEVARTTPNEFFEAVNWFTGGQAMREMLQSQLEVVTNVHVDIRDAREELKFLRREAANVAAQFGLAIMACGTHPTAIWQESQLSPKPRYTEMIEDLRAVGRRNMLCGMHVHVQLSDPARRFKVMCAMLPYIPIFIALATSSPFWNRRKTGLRGYRLAAYDELPRTGLPELFRNETEYSDYVAAMTSSGVMPDASYIWWAMRPSSRHPTLELRAPDSCTRLNDAVAIASLYRVLARHLDRIPDCDASLTNVDRAIAVENKWRAQRYGVNCTFASRDGAVPLEQLMANLVTRVAPDAEALHCVDEIEHCRMIVESGTSADGQLEAAAASNDALAAAKHWIAQKTVEGVGVEQRRMQASGAYLLE
jgi:carboxylate-amine ligase